MPVLLEIGVEELPSSFVDGALAALPDLARERLAQLRLTHGAIRALGTPRRLALLIDAVAEAQADLDEEVVGPPETAAFKDGAPTKAAEAFAAKLGIPVAELSVVEREGGPKQKPGRYVVGRRKEKGQRARDLLGAMLSDVCASIPFRKSMRWGDGDATFGRPVQWLVALFGEEVLDVRFAGLRSGRTTRGHRFLAPGTFEVTRPEAYVEQLRKAHVVVDRKEREETMMARVAATAKEAGGTYDPDPYLVAENASLVEEPHVVRGAFEPQFLALPAAVIRSVARGHQKYFCVQKSDDELLPFYLAVVNTANDEKAIARGNDRVMRARLSDARFFFEEDKKVALELRVDKLAGIVFHNRLGTVHEKVARIEALTTKLADALGMDASTKRDALRAAHLCKFDLVSLMVGEFPELQGHMGRAYAKHAGENDRVADAIRDHYKPLGASDAVAEDEVAAVVALADRLDTLTGCFAVGLSPTGAADPYALRRACIAILRTLIEHGARSRAWATLRFDELVGHAYDLFSGKRLDLSRGDTVAKVSEFAAERLRGVVALATSQAVADAVLAGHADIGGQTAAPVLYPTYAVVKARALEPLVSGRAAWLEKAKVVAKRLSGISKEAKPVLHPEAAFDSASSKTIAKVVVDVDRVTHDLTSEDAVRAALKEAEQLAVRVDDIFNTTLVNDPNDAATPKRLETLSYGARCMLRIADFSRLS